MRAVDTSRAYFYCVPVQEARPRVITVAGAVGAVQAAALIAYAGSILVFERGGATEGIAGTGANLQPVVLVALFLVFAALVLIATAMLARGRRAARTPFIMVQAFAVVVAQPLLDETSTRVLGLFVLASAVLGVVMALLRPAREFLR